MADLVPGEGLQDGAKVVGVFHQGNVGAHQFGDDKKGNGVAIEEGHLDVVGDDHGDVGTVFIDDDEVGRAGGGGEIEDFLEGVGAVDDAGRFQGDVLDGEPAEDGAIAGGPRSDAAQAEAQRVDGILVEKPGGGGGDDAGEHGGNHDLVILGDFKADENGGEGSVDDGGENGAHSDQGVHFGLN